MDKKTRPIYVLPPRDPFQIKRYTQTRWKNIFHANGKEKKGWVAVLISGKTDFKTKANKRQRRTQHDDKGNNPMRGYNPSKHLCTQHRKHLNM